MCRNLRSLCRYAEMSISDYVWDSISSSIIEISWRYLTIQIRFKCSIRIWNFSLTASTVRTVGSYCIHCIYALPYHYGQGGINGISRLPGSAFCVSAVHRCLRKLWYCRLERYGRKWRWERIPYFFAAAGDIQPKPTRVSGGLDLLGLFLFRSRSKSSHRPIPASDIPNCSESLWV
jgi:hypothetical protein